MFAISITYLYRVVLFVDEADAFLRKRSKVHVHSIHVHNYDNNYSDVMRDEKEGRKRQARSNK